MEFYRMTGPEDPWFSRAMDLYASGFPLHEQRTPADQLRAMEDPAFHSGALVENGAFAGLLFYWTGLGFTYVEHFAVAPEQRGSGLGSRALEAFCPAHAPVVLEIDPPVDGISVRRRDFYRRLGFAENACGHRHPAYRRGFQPHPLTVMSWPEPLAPEAYRTFYAELSERIMRYAQV